MRLTNTTFLVPLKKNICNIMHMYVRIHLYQKNGSDREVLQAPHGECRDEVASPNTHRLSPTTTQSQFSTDCSLFQCCAFTFGVIRLWVLCFILVTAAGLR